MAEARPIRIEQVSGSDRRQIRAFIEFPKELYRGNDCFVPWFDRGMRTILTGRHPFFEHSQGEFFLAFRGQQVVGRIALLDPKKFNSYQDRRDCRLYFFDVIEDQQTAYLLFDHAKNWASERGLDRLIGPQGFSGFTGAGILIKGYEHKASMTMMNYHFPYYRRFFESYGFSTYKDFYSAELTSETFILPQQIRSIQEISRKRNGLSVRTIRDRRELRALGYAIMEMYNAAFVSHEKFCPMTKRELEQTIRDLLTVTDPQLVKVIEHDRQPVGFLLTFPDLTEGIQAANGRLTPRTLLRLLHEKKSAERFIINGIGILPEYQSRGGTAILFYELMQTLQNRQARSAEMTQIAESTNDMVQSIRKLHGEIYKIHRIYELKL
jgi:hypothetical protein